jgi:hypothetical protein
LPHKEKFTNVSPGDMIGAERNGIDFTTGFTLVDLRPDPMKSDRTIAWLLTPEGQLVKRDVSADSNNADRKKLEEQINAANVGAAGGNPGAAVVGGAPAMINPTR